MALIEFQIETNGLTAEEAVRAIEEHTGMVATGWSEADPEAATCGYERLSRWLAERMELPEKLTEVQVAEAIRVLGNTAFRVSLPLLGAIVKLHARPPRGWALLSEEERSRVIARARAARRTTETV
jgi:hypothetical protein